MHQSLELEQRLVLLCLILSLALSLAQIAESRHHHQTADDSAGELQVKDICCLAFFL